MAGAKGRSGGPRANAGGARPGAGRPKKDKEPKPPAQVAERDPLQFLLDVMQGLVEANPTQLRAAIAATQYMHAKKGESSGKKDEAETKQKAASAGRFGKREAPRLAAAGGKAV